MVGQTNNNDDDKLQYIVLNSSCLRGSTIRTSGAAHFAPLGAWRPSWSGGHYFDGCCRWLTCQPPLNSAVLNNIPVRGVDKGRHLHMYARHV